LQLWRQCGCITKHDPRFANIGVPEHEVIREPKRRERLARDVERTMERRREVIPERLR
jgi:hypothetical protein